MGTSSAAASISQAGILIGYRGEKDGREVIVCGQCGRGQFNRGQDACRACHQPFIIFLEPLDECDARQPLKAFSPRSVSTRVRLLRIALGISQQELADAMGCVRSHLFKIETGMVIPTIASLERIVRTLRLGLDEFLDERMGTDELALLSLVRSPEGLLLRELVALLPFLREQGRAALLAAAMGAPVCQ